MTLLVFHPQNPPKILKVTLWNPNVYVCDGVQRLFYFGVFASAKNKNVTTSTGKMLKGLTNEEGDRVRLFTVVRFQIFHCLSTIFSCEVLDEPFFNFI